MKISFHSHTNASSYEKISTRTRFEKEAKGNSEMAHLVAYNFKPNDLLQFILVLWHYRKYDTLSNAIFVT